MGCAHHSLYISGTIPVNTPLTITVKATDNSAVKTVYLYVNNVPVELTQGAGDTYTGTYTPSNTGTYNVNVAAWDIQGNASERGAIINSADPTTLPSSIPNSPPMVITAGLYPFDGATEVNVDQTLEIPFTEPVNITETNLYVKEAGTDTRIPMTILPPELSPGIYKILLKAASYLDFDKQYEIIITDGIRDLDNEVLSNPMTISFHTKKIEEVGSLSDTRFIDSVIDTDKKRLYAVDRNDGFYIINIEDPKNPKLAAKRDISKNLESLTSKEGITLTADKADAVVVGWSNRSSASYMWLVTTDEKLNDPYRTGELLLTGSNILNSWAQQSTYVPVYGGYGYTYESSGLSGYDNNGGVAHKAAVVGNKAYVASLFLGVQVVDLSKVLLPNNLGNPIISTIDTKQGTSAIDTFPRNIKALHTTAPSAKLITITNEALIAIDPNSDSIMWTLDLSGYGSFFRMELAEDVYYTDATGAQQTMDLAFVTTSYAKKLLIIDITNTPTIIKEMLFTDPVFKVHYNKEHKLLFVQSGNNLLVYELNSMLSSNLQQTPRQVGVYEGGGYANDIISDDKYLYIGELGNFRVVQYDPDRIKVKVIDPPENKIFDFLQGRNEILITNDGNGNPKMPSITAEATIYNANGVPRTLSQTEINNLEICWQVKVEYKVKTPKAPSRERKGLDTSDGIQMPPYDCIKIKGKLTLTIGYASNILTKSDMKWEDIFGMEFMGGGLLTITAKTKIDGDDRQGTYSGKIEGERTTPEFRAKMIKYLKDEGKALETELGSADVLFALACIETYGVNHFYPPIVAGDKIPDGSQYGVPKGSNYPFENTTGDGGFGVMQLTNPKPTYKQIWHWKENIDRGVEFVNEKISQSKTLAPDVRKELNKTDKEIRDLITEELRKNVYSRFRGGHYWKWDKDKDTKQYDWVPKYDKDSKDEKEREKYNKSGLPETDKAFPNEGKTTCQ